MIPFPQAGRVCAGLSSRTWRCTRRTRRASCRCKPCPLTWQGVRRFEFADLEVYASDEDGELSVSTEADESEEVSDSGSDAADEVDAFFCTLIRAGSAIGCVFYCVPGCRCQLSVVSGSCGCYT